MNWLVGHYIHVLYGTEFYPHLYYFQEFLKLLAEPFILKVIKAVAQPGPHCMDDPRRINKQWNIYIVCNTS